MDDFRPKLLDTRFDNLMPEVSFGDEVAEGREEFLSHRG